MAAVTKGHIVLRNMGTGNTRVEYFTVTAANAAFAVYANNNQNFILISPEGEAIVDILMDGDGTTTVSNVKMIADGQDIRNRLMLLSLIGTTQTTRLPSAIQVRGNRQFQMQFFT